MDYSMLSDFGNPLTLLENLSIEHEELEEKIRRLQEKKRLLERAIAYIREHEGLNKED